MKFISLILMVNMIVFAGYSQSVSTIREYKKTYLTYPFSDPDPVPSQTAIYPYFRYDGFTNTPLNKEWTVVELENDFIRVSIMPEIGGKIWSAVDKKTGMSFLYDNKVVKFRDVAMRGPWTSGGLEPNYGIIGHTPNCATPVDYTTRKNDDGSVSCFVSVLDLLTRTRWQIEINLQRDKAYFTTNSLWNNPSGLNQPYYHWMNTGIKTKGNLEFIYPGTAYIGHDGEHASWPVNKENGRKINFYDENDFGTYKSYHVIGKHTDFFGAYWHDDDFGMVRYAPYDEKPGKKIWIWGLSRQGMIWEKMLTDNDGQYAEVQSGRLFNQNSRGSSRTPFKHAGFIPHGTERWTEYWYPVKQTKGMVVANASAALNIKIENGWIKWYCSPVAYFKDQLVIKIDGKIRSSIPIDAKPLEVLQDSFAIESPTPDVSVALINQYLEWNNQPAYKSLSRPLESPHKFDWSSSEGLALQARELIDQKFFAEAEIKLEQALTKDSNSILGLVKMAELQYRNGKYYSAFLHAKRAISIDAHEPGANYYYGISSAQLNMESDALDGLGVAALGIEYRSAAYVEIAKLHARRSRWQYVQDYAEKALQFNSMDVTARWLNMIALRLSGKSDEYKKQLETFGSLFPLNPFFKWENKSADRPLSNSSVTLIFKNELPEETLLELSSSYVEVGLIDEADSILSLIPHHPISLYVRAFLKKTDINSSLFLLEQANKLPSYLVFPFRTEHLPVLEWVVSKSNHWKPKYYLALLLNEKNRHNEAIKILRNLEDIPDEPHFYGLRAIWNKENQTQKERDLSKAMIMDPQSWRYPKLLVQHFISQNNHEKALQLCLQYKNMHPARDFIMDMLLAKTLLLNRKYAACDSLLSKMDIIPFEGSTEGRSLYWEAKMMQAVQAIKLGRYKQALSFIQQASLWPENLGVGKPYDSEIDSRLEQYFSFVCLSALKQKEKATQQLDAILQFEPGIHNTTRNFQPANHLVTRWAIKSRNSEMDWEKWMNRQKELYPQFIEIFNWVYHASQEINGVVSETISQDPWTRVISAYLMK